MFFPGGFTFSNFLVDALSIFLFVVWFWLFIRITRDLFDREDISAPLKVVWVVILILIPYIGVFVYILGQGRNMAIRHQARMQKMYSELREFTGFSVADELEKLDRLKSTGALSDDEYKRVRARLVD